MYTIKSVRNFSWLRYAAIFFLSLLTLFCAISLFSYYPYDPSWFYISSEVVPVHNAAGIIGAHCAAFLFYFFGRASFIILFLLSFVDFMLITKQPIKKEWERLLAYFFLVCICCALLHSSYHGGLIGLKFMHILHNFFGLLGTEIFLRVSLCASFFMLTRFSFMPLIQIFFKVLICLYYFAIEYRIVQRFAYVVALIFYSFFVRPPLFFVSFMQSLLNGSAFDGTDLLQLNDDDELENIMHLFDDEKIDHVIKNENTVVQADNDLHEIIKNEINEQENNEHNIEKKNESNGTFAQAKITPEKIIEQKNTYELPSRDIFIGERSEKNDHDLEQELQERAVTLEDKLKRFGVNGTVVAIKRGPVVTLFEYQPEIDTKLSKILSLEDDLAMALQALSIRIIAPIPGRSVVGFEVANKKRKDVLFSHVITQSDYKKFSGMLPLVLGKDTIGDTVVVDLARMPHLLIAGSTGSGKSVALNTMLMSLLCALNPDELKLILIDPKRLEFAAYADIAHLLFPIVTHPHYSIPILKWVVQEMEQRYEKMAERGARNITDYNETIKTVDDHEPLPLIVVVIDELADLMLTAGREIEDLITRITQMARAAGIHMIVATQRPSVDVITGLIKANFPSRISFRVASRIDSRTILDTNGADRLLGRGDMLFMDATTSQLRRVHGAYVSDEEINRVVSHIRAQRKVIYLDIHKEIPSNNSELSEADDQLYSDVLSFLDEVDEVSISLLQRKFRIGYNRSARIIDMLENQGLIMPPDGSKTRKVIR